MYLFITAALLVATIHAEIILELYDQNDNLLDNSTQHEFGPGDYVECRFEGDVEHDLHYGWVKIPPEGTPVEAPGPTFLVFNNEQPTMYNRLHIGKFLGEGEPTGYRCIAADADTYPQRNQLVGTRLYFNYVDDEVDRVIGTVFPAVDRVGRLGDLIQMECTRTQEAGRVQIMTLNVNNYPTNIIYDSKFWPRPLPSWYNLVEIPGTDPRGQLNFTFTVELYEFTALEHRCLVRDGGLEIHNTAMLIVADHVGEAEDCTTEGLEETNNAGDLIHMSCHIEPLVSEWSLMDPDRTTVITYWQMSTAVEPGVFTPIESTYMLDGESSLVVTASSATAGNTYVCTTEIHREYADATRGVLHNACSGDGYTINVAPGTFSIRMYYGERDNMADEDFIDFDSRNEYKTDIVEDADLTCEVVNADDPDGEEILMQVRAPLEEDWTDTSSHVVQSDDIELGSQYRCVRRLDGNQEYSGVINIVDGIVPTAVYTSSGELVDGDIEVNIGDYLECRPTEPTSERHPPKFVWTRDGGLANMNGPQEITYGTENTPEGPVTRLYIDFEMGRGLPIVYDCIGTDNLKELDRDTDGARVRFWAVEIAAGEVFDEGDYTQREGEVLTLTCTRANEGVRVMWETLDSEGEATVIYDSSVGDPLPEHYAFTSSDPEGSNDYSLDITVTADTATFTRCTVMAPEGSRQYTTASQTAMIYALGNILECTSNQGSSADVGEAVRFSGCGATVIVAANALSMEDQYQAVVHWTRTDENGTHILEDSRVLNTESIHNEVALTEYDGNTYQCGIQISRPNALTNSAVVTDLCQNEFTLDVTDGTVRFRAYYGDMSNMEDFLDLRYPENDLAKEDGLDLTCEVDRHPVSDDDTVIWQKRTSPTDEWEDLNSDVVPDDEIASGDQFRCVNQGSADTVSNIIEIVSGINDLVAVEIFDSAGNLLDDNTPYDLYEGDYVECRPADESVVVPAFVWVKSIQVGPANGPSLIKVPNVLHTNTNRLRITYFLGEGQDVAYRCIAGEDFGVGFTELMGRKIEFRVQSIDENAAGIAALSSDYARVVGDTVGLGCLRHSEEYRLVWSTVPAIGAEQVIYDTDNPQEPTGDYHLEVVGEKYDLRVTVNQDTALLHKCTVTDPTGEKNQTEGTAMIFAIEANSQCTADGLQASNGLGDEVHFTGCTADVITAENSGVGPEVYDIIAYWSRGETDSGNFDAVDSTRVLTMEGMSSEYHMEVSSVDDQQSYRCMVEVKRPLEAKTGSVVDNVCDQQFDVKLIPDDTWFRVYYGEEATNLYRVTFKDDSDDEETVNVGYIEDWQVLCEAEQHPGGITQAMVEERLEGGEWTQTGQPEVAGVEDASYRCYLADGTRSATIELSPGPGYVPPLGIYYNGVLVTEGTVLDTLEDEFLECKPLDDVTASLRYLWVKTADEDIEGPLYINNDNEEDESNRLKLNMNLGAGTTTSYRCTANTGEDLIPGEHGPVVNFNVNNVTLDAGHHIEASIACVVLALLAYMYNR